MKKLFLIFAMACLVGTASFAQRVLTDAERQTLLGSSSFLEQSQWAVRNYAAYWAIHDGSGFSTEAQRIKWAKDRMLSVDISVSDIHDNDLALKFATLMKNIQITIGAAPQDPDTIVAEMLTESKFETLASMYFDLLGEGINFSLGN